MNTTYRDAHKDMSDDSPINRLPSELLLQTLANFNASFKDDKQILIILCKVSRVFAAAAQEILHRNVAFHPKSSSGKRAIRFLRTILERPELALKVKTFNASSYISGFYGDEMQESGFPVESSMAKMAELGFDVERMKHRHEVVMVAMLENLEELNLGSVGHFGYMLVEPSHRKPGIPAFRNIWKLTMEVTNVPLLALDFPKLTHLKMVESSYHGNELGGPGSLPGAPRLQDLDLEIYINKLWGMSDDYFIRQARVVRKIFVATGCSKVSNFTYNFGVARRAMESGRGPSQSMHTDRLLELLKDLPNLQSLNLEFSSQDPEIMAWLVDKAVPVTTLQYLTSLKTLVIPQDLLFRTEHETSISQVLPTYLQTLEILGPNENLFGWMRELPNARHLFPDLNKIVLRTEQTHFGKPAEFFLDHEDLIWNHLGLCDISCFVHTRENSDQQQSSVWHKLSGPNLFID